MESKADMAVMTIMSILSLAATFKNRMQRKYDNMLSSICRLRKDILMKKLR